MRYEEILQNVGGFGTFQKKVILFVCLPQIFIAFTSLTPNFILGEHEHRCRIPEQTDDTYASNLSAIYNVTKCTYVYNSTIQSCSSWVYDQSIYTDTLISTFNMVCERKFYRSHLVLAQHLGTFFGSFIGSFCADTLGRKPTFVISGCLLFLSNIVLPWSNSVYLVAFLRFMNGVSLIMNYVAGFVLATEMVIPSKRMSVSFCIWLLYTLGQYIMDLIAYFERDWHGLILYTSLPICVYLLYWFILPESPRWLVVKGKSKRAFDILNKMSTVNKSNFILETKTIEISDGDQLQSFYRSLRAVLASKTLLLRILILAFNWSALTLTYYGISMNVGKLGGDVYINFFVSSTVGLAGVVISNLAAIKIGRKPLHITLMLIGGIACLSTIFTSLYAPHALTITLAMIGKLAVTGAFFIIYLYTAELSPTVIRGFVMNFCSCVGRIGSICSSYIGDLGILVDSKFGRALPLIIFGCVSTAAGLLCFFLPETKDKALPETTNDAEKMAGVVENGEQKDEDIKLIEKRNIDSS